MLNVKSQQFNPFKQKKNEKRREFWPRLQKISSSARIFFFCNLVSRFGLILTKILFSIEWK